MAESSETSILNTSVGDQSTGDDTLGFTPYVTAVAEFLTNAQTKPPLTMSIEGKWGSGKSSFMEQLQKKIELSQQKASEEKIDNFEKSIRRRLYRIFYDYDINRSKYEGLKIDFKGLKIDFEWKFIKIKNKFLLVSRIFRAGSKTKKQSLLYKVFRKPKSGARINKDTNDK
jgi:hypothetical protein